MDRRGSWEAAPPPPPVAALKRGAVLHGQLLVSFLAFLPGTIMGFYVEYLFLGRLRTCAAGPRFLLTVSTLM